MTISIKRRTKKDKKIWLATVVDEIGEDILKGNVCDSRYAALASLIDENRKTFRITDIITFLD